MENFNEIFAYYFPEGLTPNLREPYTKLTKNFSLASLAQNRMTMFASLTPADVHTILQSTILHGEPTLKPRITPGDPPSNLQDHTHIGPCNLDRQCQHSWQLSLRSPSEDGRPWCGATVGDGGRNPFEGVEFRIS